MGDPNEKPEMTTSTGGGSVVVVGATVVVGTTVVEVVAGTTVVEVVAGTTVVEVVAGTTVVEGATVFETPAQAETTSRTAVTATRVASLTPEPYALLGMTPQRIRAQ